MNAAKHIGNLPIRRKLMLLLLVPCIAIVLFEATVLVALQISTFKRVFQQDLCAVADIAAHNCTAAITFNDDVAAAETLNALRAKEHIMCAYLVLTNNQIFARYGIDKNRLIPSVTTKIPSAVYRQNFLLVTRPVFIEQKQIGTLYVLSDYNSVSWSFLRVIGWTLGLIILVALAVGSRVTKSLQKFVADPVISLAGTARRVAELGDYSVRTVESPGTDFSVLTRAFNQMLERIQSQDSALQNASRELLARVKQLEYEISEREKAEKKLAEVHQELLLASRQAGMAEVASEVLHNVGNVLNSVNVSTNLLCEKLINSRGKHLCDISEMLRQHMDNLGQFLAADPKGKVLPSYLINLFPVLEKERTQMVDEAKALSRNVEHVKSIISMQQRYARVGGAVEMIEIANLVEDALQIHAGAFARQSITVVRLYSEVPVITVDKHKVLQILLNLVQNARHALETAMANPKTIKIQIASRDQKHIRVIVQDNGVGIAPENLSRIFKHGFTTKKNGHGFGLHSAIKAANEMGGELFAQSDGLGSGAKFTLDLPLLPNCSGKA